MLNVTPQIDDLPLQLTRFQETLNYFFEEISAENFPKAHFRMKFGLLSPDHPGVKQGSLSETGMSYRRTWMSYYAHRETSGARDNALSYIPGLS